MKAYDEEIKVFNEVLGILGPLPEDSRLRVMAAAAILLDLVPERVLTEVIRSARAA